MAIMLLCGGCGKYVDTLKQCRVISGDMKHDSKMWCQECVASKSSRADCPTCRGEHRGAADPPRLIDAIISAPATSINFCKTCDRPMRRDVYCATIGSGICARCRLISDLRAEGYVRGCLEMKNKGSLACVSK